MAATMTPKRKALLITDHSALLTDRSNFEGFATTPVFTVLGPDFVGSSTGAMPGAHPAPP